MSEDANMCHTAHVFVTQNTVCSQNYFIDTSYFHSNRSRNSKFVCKLGFKFEKIGYPQVTPKVILDLNFNRYCQLKQFIFKLLLRKAMLISDIMRGTIGGNEWAE